MAQKIRDDKYRYEGKRCRENIIKICMDGYDLEQLIGM